MVSEERHGVRKHWHLWPLCGRPQGLPRRQICAVSVLGADAEPLLAAQVQQHIRLKRERGQRRALATTLVLLDQAQQAEDLLEPDEPRHRR
jgi:hypothetical protein